MGPVEVVEPFPFRPFCLEIDGTFIAEKLVEILAVSSVRSLDFAVQLRCSASDIGVADTNILDVPVKLCLELVTAMSADFLYAEGKLLNDVVDKIDRIGLSMLDIFRARTRVTSPIAVYWKRWIFSPFCPVDVRNLTSIWM